MEVTNVAALTESISEQSAIDSASDTDCDNSARALQTATSTAAIAVVDTLRMHVGSLKLGKNFGL